MSRLIERVHIVYHGVDNDGYFSAALAHLYFEKRFNLQRDIKYVKRNGVDAAQSIFLYPGFYEYGSRATTSIIDKMANKNPGTEYNDIVVITDFSFEKSLFKNFVQQCRENGCNDILWFDHHGKTLEDLQECEELKDLLGTRDPNTAATRLMFDYTKDMDPEFSNKIFDLIDHVARYDVWDWNDKDMTDPVLLVNTALTTHLKGSFKDKFNGKVYDAISLLNTFNSKSPIAIMNRLVEKGRIIQEYVEYQWNYVRGSYINQALWKITDKEGKSKTYKIAIGNITAASSLTFAHVIEKVDFVMAWRLKKDIVMCSLYSSKHSSNFDITEICTPYGGGGHRNAGGFHTTWEDFCQNIFPNISIIPQPWEKKQS